MSRDKYILKSPVLTSVMGCGRQDDKFVPSISDLTVLTVDGIQTVVVTDDANNAVKSLYTKNTESCISKLLVHDGPWGITKFKEKEVMVTIPYCYQIITVEVNPDLVMLSTIATKKRYHSVAVLGPSSLAAGNDHPGCVDILNMEGHVMRSVTTDNNVKLFVSPWYMCVNHKGRLLVSDRWRNSVTCLTSKGKVVWKYAPTGDKALRHPVGVICCGKRVLVVDRDSHKVIQLTKKGHYVQDILTLDAGDNDPWSICEDGNSLFVCCVSKVKRFELQSI